MTLQHLRGRGLLLQRFAQLVEQARVLDGDDGLGGEVLHQLDLLVGERADLLAVDADRADQLVFLEHRHERVGPSAAELDEPTASRDRAPHMRLAARSAICARLPGSSAAPAECPVGMDGWGRVGVPRRRPAAHCEQRHAEFASSQIEESPNLASQMRTAFSSMASNTGSSSPGELEMTRSTSEVAACCSSASAQLPFQIASARVIARWVHRARLRLRSARTKLATVRSALRAFARHRHLVGTSIDPGSPGEPRKTISRPGRRCVRRA